MRRTKPVLAVAALAVWIVGKQWLRSKGRQPAWQLP